MLLASPFTTEFAVLRVALLSQNQNDQRGDAIRASNRRVCHLPARRVPISGRCEDRFGPCMNRARQPLVQFSDRSGNHAFSAHRPVRTFATSAPLCVSLCTSAARISEGGWFTMPVSNCNACGAAEAFAENSRVAGAAIAREFAAAHARDRNLCDAGTSSNSSLAHQNIVSRAASDTDHSRNRLSA